MVIYQTQVTTKVYDLNSPLYLSFNIHHTMDQSTAFESAKACDQPDSLSTMAIRSIDQLKRLLKDLDGLPTKPPSIYLDASGVGQYELIDLQLLVLPTNTLYLVNMKGLGTPALSTVGGNNLSLRHILESKDIPKIGFDIRDMSKLLINQLNLTLGGMYDLQLMELASRDHEQSKKFLAGFAKCVNQDIPSSNGAKGRWLNPNDTSNLHLFNSLGHAPRQTIKRVELFPALWTVYRRKLGRPGQMMWLRFARTESQERVRESNKNSNGDHKQHLGPLTWWNRELREAAVDDWNDWLFVEMNAGDWELDDDAEWVPTSKNKQSILFDSSQD
jgi:exonuclease 3'-5' domain-containing protein 1